jgi:hypothetical protein
MSACMKKLEKNPCLLFSIRGNLYVLSCEWTYLFASNKKHGRYEDQPNYNLCISTPAELQFGRGGEKNRL